MGNEVREWVEGEALLFDDSFEHEVWWRHGGTEGSPSISPDDAVERVVLIVDVFHPELPEAERVKIRAQMATQHSADATAAEPVTVEPPQPQAAAPDWSLLAGGYRAGDEVVSLVEQSDRTQLKEGEVGMVSGGGQTGSGKIYVDFGGKRWHVAPHTIMRRMEHVADLLDQSGEESAAEEDPVPMRVRVVRQDPLMLAVEGFASDSEIDTIVRLGSPHLDRCASLSSLSPPLLSSPASRRILLVVPLPVADAICSLPVKQHVRRPLQYATISRIFHCKAQFSGGNIYIISAFSIQKSKDSI